MACLPNHLSNWIVIQSRHWILITIIYPRFRWGPSIAKCGPIITWWMNEWVKWISFSKMDSNLKRRQGKYWWSCHWAQSSRWSHYIRGDLVLHHGNLSQSDSKCSGVLSNFCCLYLVFDTHVVDTLAWGFLITIANSSALCRVIR